MRVFLIGLPLGMVLAVIAAQFIDPKYYIPLALVLSVVVMVILTWKGVARLLRPSRS